MLRKNFKTYWNIYYTLEFEGICGISRVDIVKKCSLLSNFENILSYNLKLNLYSNLFIKENQRACSLLDPRCYR